MDKGQTRKKTPPLEQADGRKDNPIKKTLDEIIGTGKRKYHQTNLDEYKNYLKGLNLTDMQAHAQQVGLIPIAERRTLESRLVKEFQKTANKYYGTAIAGDPPKVSERALRILANGR